MMFGLGHVFLRLLFGAGMGFGMTFLWILPVVLIVWLVASASGNRPTSLSGYGPATPVGQDPAVEIVRERFARGEIGRPEFERLMAELLGKG
jgi:uncharacterized membrane protein